MAWGRLALVQAAGESEVVLHKMAEMFGYQTLPSQDQQSGKVDRHSQNAETIQTNSGSSTDDTVEGLPARFLRVNKIVHINDEAPQKPGYLDDPGMCLQASVAPKGTYKFATPRPLLSMSRLIPFLFNSLGQTRIGGRLDHRSIAWQIAQGKALQRLPRLHQKRWPQRLQIIVDASLRLEPYWADFAYIIEQLKHLMGDEAVAAIRLDDGAQDVTAIDCIQWPTQDNDRWSRWHNPPLSASILILGDLGMSVEHSATHVRWQRLAKRLRAHPAPILTLSPAAQSPQNQALCRQFQPSPLHDQVSLPRHPYRKAFPCGSRVSTPTSIL